METKLLEIGKSRIKDKLQDINESDFTKLAVSITDINLPYF